MTTFCADCGNTLNPDAAFCGECGYRVTAAAEPHEQHEQHEVVTGSVVALDDSTEVDPDVAALGVEAPDEETEDDGVPHVDDTPTPESSGEQNDRASSTADDAPPAERPDQEAQCDQEDAPHQSDVTMLGRAPVSSTATAPGASATPLAGTSTMHAGATAHAAAPHGRSASMGYPTPGYGAYPPGPPQPQTPPKRGVGAVLVGVGAVLLLTVGFVGTFFFLNREAEAAPAGDDAPVTTAAEVAPVEVAPEATDHEAIPEEHTTTPAAPTQQAAPVPVTPRAAPVPQRYTLHHRASGFSGHFSQAGTLTTSTSEPFMRAVANRYAESVPFGSSTVLSDVYSPVTGKSYTMNCDAQDAGEVICSGGNNARVILFND